LQELTLIDRILDAGFEEMMARTFTSLQSAPDHDRLRVRWEALTASTPFCEHGGVEAAVLPLAQRILGTWSLLIARGAPKKPPPLIQTGVPSETKSLPSDARCS
jgi:hypothetical protein